MADTSLGGSRDSCCILQSYATCYHCNLDAYDLESCVMSRVKSRCPAPRRCQHLSVESGSTFPPQFIFGPWIPKTGPDSHPLCPTFLSTFILICLRCVLFVDERSGIVASRVWKVACPGTLTDFCVSICYVKPFLNMYNIFMTQYCC